MAVSETNEILAALREMNEEERREAADLLRPHLRTVNRRRILQAGGALGVGALFGLGATETARADAVGTDWGSEADPWQKMWTHAIESGDGADFLTLGDAIQHANEAVSSSTIIGSVCYIEVDTSVASNTVTIPAFLEASGIELRFIDAGGSAGSNSFDVTSTNWNIDGGGTVTVDVSDTAFVLYSAGDRWVSHRFTQRLDARLLDVTGETYAELDRGSNSSSTSANTWINAYDGENADNLNEVNASAQFSPSESGRYQILARARFLNGSTGDNYEIRIQNVTDGTEIRRYVKQDGGDADSIQLNAVVNLTTGKSYEIQVRNTTSSYVVNDGGTDAEIFKQTVHP